MMDFEEPKMIGELGNHIIRRIHTDSIAKGIYLIMIGSYIFLGLAAVLLITSKIKLAIVLILGAWFYHTLGRRFQIYYSVAKESIGYQRLIFVLFTLSPELHAKFLLEAARFCGSEEDTKASYAAALKKASETIDDTVL